MRVTLVGIGQLKPENILYASPESSIIKVADFGLSRFCSDESVMKSSVGSPDYMCELEPAALLVTHASLQGAGDLAAEAIRQEC